MTGGPGGWRVALTHGPLTLRPIARSDRKAWQDVRRRNHDWLTPWDATRPVTDPAGSMTVGQMISDLRRQARAGRALPLALLVDGVFAGQVTVSNIVRGSAQTGSAGYWIDRRFAGRGHVPMALAMVVDHCLAGLGLHRIEVAIRPENAASLRVVEKLGLTEVGYAPRYLHINGEWRDHRLFAVTAEEVPGGLVRRLLD